MMTKNQPTTITETEWHECPACDAVFYGATCLRCQAEMWERRNSKEQERPVMFWSESLGCYVTIPDGA